MRGMPLNGIGGPKFRSEALGAELAHKIAEEREGKALSSIQESRSPSPNWPAVPFTSVNQDRVNVNSVYDDGAIVSEETQSRALLADEDSIIAAAKKYRPPTPGNRPEDAYRPSYVPSVTSPPIRISSLPSPKSSRFSADSAVSDEVTRSSIMGRSIRKLWRKTGTAAAAANKISVAAKNNTQKRGSSPPPPLPSAPPLSSSYLTSGSGNLGMPASATSSTFNFSGSTSSRPDSGLDPFHFDQESLRSPSPTAGAQSSPSGTTLKSTRSILKGRKPAPDTPPSILAPAPEKERGISGFFSRARKSHVPQAPSSPGAEGAVSEKRPSEESRRNSPPGQIPTSKSSTSVNRVLPPGVPKLFPTGFPLTASRSSFELDDGYRPSIDSGVGMGNALEEPVTPRLSQFEIVSPSLKTFDFK
ncbi:hypothetical protein FRC03_011032 [Tulasnella sp. 419]|nr:hypothetical protein FRC03_011032 [Tulasnella sp. 419]